jgi:DHA2 family multidrug resistance protein
MAVAAAIRADPSVRYRWIILFGLITAAILEVLDTTIVNVSLPHMAGNLGVTSEEIAWVSTGYILSNVVVLPITAWLASRFGRKRYLSGSILLFVIASFFCGTSTTLTSLVVWRILQGAGGAALLSTSQATIREIFPAEQQSFVQAIYILGIIAAPTLGPTAGGWITDNFSWHWVFFINLPIGLVSFFIVSTFLEDSEFTMATHRVDWIGLALMVAGLASLQYVLEEGNSRLWFEDGRMVVLATIAILALPIFVWWQLSPRNKAPIVNLRVLANRDLSAALILFIVLGFGLYGGVFLFPMFTQGVLGLTPTETGLALLPGGIATGISAILTGRLANPAKIIVDPRIMIVSGLGLFFVSMYSLAHLPPTGSVDDAFIALILRGFGLGMLFVPINLAAFATLKGAEIAQGSALLNLCRQLGGSFGIAVLSSFVTHQAASARAGLVNHIFVGNPALDSRFAAMTQAMVAKGYAAGAPAQHAAASLLNAQVQGQATAIAYNSSFMLIAIVVLVASPLILLLRKARITSARPVAH